MSNPIAICNSALLTLGANTINALSDTSLEGRACNAKWDIARKDLIRSHPWNFAVRRAQLAATVLGPEYQYSYKFTLPANALRLLEVFTNYEYRIEGRDILTNDISNPNAPQIEIKYVSDVTDPSTWDANFTNVMVYRMAMELAYTLPGKNTMIEQMAMMYTSFLEQAKGVDASEDVEDPLDPFTSPMIATRFHY